jgi:hypothetical protein
MWDGIGVQLRESWLVLGTLATPPATPTCTHARVVSFSIHGLGSVVAVTAGSPSSSTAGLPTTIAYAGDHRHVSDDEQYSIARFWQAYSHFNF